MSGADGAAVLLHHQLGHFVLRKLLAVMPEATKGEVELKLGPKQHAKGDIGVYGQVVVKRRCGVLLAELLTQSGNMLSDPGLLVAVRVEHLREQLRHAIGGDARAAPEYIALSREHTG